MMKLSFHGADRGVTGSCHLIECAGNKILIDCGLYQGGRKIVEENLESFGFEPCDIDHLLLTHAHLDHCGRIPLLDKPGFHGEIIATAATIELARLVMLDCAGLQEEEARYRSRRQRHHGNDDKTIEPLYTTLDALNSLEFIGRRASYDKPVEIFGEEIPVRASIHTIGGFSAHADQAELLAWQQQTGNPQTTFLVHGEEEVMRSFAENLSNTQVEMPVLHQVYEL